MTDKKKNDLRERYDRNRTVITEEDNNKLKAMTACVVGCGGLGGHIIELIARVGVGHIICVDGDVFEASNLNRQLLSTEENIGMSKAAAAAERIAAVNSETEVTALKTFFDADNGREILKGCDIVFDALDNIESRRLLAELASGQGIPLIHGAVAGWYGQVTVVYPGDDTFRQLFPEDINKGAEVELGNPSFTPAAVAAIEAAEGIKVLLGKGEILRGRLLTVDLLTQEHEIVELPSGTGREK
ncbi:MAG: HesA/MoeB/ThiF family protein [Eubacteriaceae bacterium]|nr:HesA/MoeB/ThiF family protein [Eubacteriaceae bacterium]